MILRDYQWAAVEFLFPRPRGLIWAPAGSGKTIIAATAVSQRVKSGQRVVWLGNTREQVEQGIAAIQRVPGPEGVEFEVCCVAADPDTSAADILIFDECHHLPAESWLRLIERAKPGCIVWGFTATPFGTDTLRNDIVKAAFGEVFKIERARVEASGHLAPGKVYVHDLDAPGQYDQEINARVAIEARNRFFRFPQVAFFEHERRVKWQITQEYLQANETRNAAAVSIVRTEAAAGHSTLVLVHSIEHGTSLAGRLPGAGIVHSKLGARARREFIAGFRDGSQRILFATSLADEGLDVPRASRLVLIAGGRSPGKLEQRAGRVLRPFEGKSGGVIHDFADAGACFAAAQAKARFKTYTKLGYDPEIVSYREAKAA